MTPEQAGPIQTEPVPSLAAPWEATSEPALETATLEPTALVRAEPPEVPGTAPEAEGGASVGHGQSAHP